MKHSSNAPHSLKIIIELKHLRKSYFLKTGVEIPVLKGIDLKVYENEFIAVMGESGGGKSTLMNILGCLHSHTSGDYILNGENMSLVKDDKHLSRIRNREIGFIFQQFNLLPKLTALQNVALPGMYAGISREKREERAREMLQAVGLADRADHKPSELSGGQQQRVSIARAFVNNPNIILADEPTGALDTHTGKEILQLLLRFKEQGKTAIVITHDPKVAAYADRIVFLQDGMILSDNYKIE